MSPAALDSIAETSGRFAVKSFLDLYGDTPLRELIADWPLESLSDQDGNWLNFPPHDFLEWARNFPRYPSFDGVPPSTSYKKPPTFLLCQSHKFWLSGRLAARWLPPTGTLVDLGSFPFFLPLALRDYFGHRGRLVGTAIQPISSETQAALDKHEVELEIVDLDPHVVDTTKDRKPPDRLDRFDASADVVTMLHVVEHLYHPMSALNEAHRILKAGGRLIITTDNAMMLNTLLNYIGGYGYVFEPVASTCAMSFHDWRGHVRFFTASDLETMVRAAGFSVEEIGYEEIFYEVFHEDYFAEPRPHLSRWRIPVLKQQRQFANDVYIVAVKR